MGTRPRLALPGFLVVLILAVVFHPVALAQSAWEEDGWLRTSLAQERLDAGDEFGCYGMPGLSWQNDAGRWHRLAGPISKSESMPASGVFPPCRHFHHQR